MTLKTPLYPKSLLFLFACVLQPAFGAAGDSASVSLSAKAAEDKTTVTTPIATDPALAPLVTTLPLPAAPAQPERSAVEAEAAVQKREPGEAVAAAGVQEGGLEAPAAQAAAAVSPVFPKISPRWRKWELGVIADHARKNSWQPLAAGSVRIVLYNGLQNRVGTAFQVNLETGEVNVLSGQEDVPKIRSFKLQSAELGDLKKLLEGKSFADLAAENQTIGRDGQSLLIEADWQGEYRWRLYWGEFPYPLADIQNILQKAYTRDQQQRG